LKNTTLPNLDNKYLIKNDINGDSFTGTLKVNSIDVIPDSNLNLHIGESA
jgi:hypothetical protein